MPVLDVDGAEFVRELFYSTAPVYISVEEGDGATDEPRSLMVRGFVSVQSPTDRSRDVVPPEEFRIPQFMAAPTLLVNHKLWIDPMGNGVAVGRPTELYPAKLVDIEGNSENWGVYDLEQRTVRNRLPKVRVPNLSKGDRGLFAVAEVTEPEVARRVRAGELSAFSWRGLTSVEYRKDGDSGQVRRYFTDIDMFEVSLVNMPDNPDATVTVGKAVDCRFVEERRIEVPLAVYSVSLDKSRFVTEKMAVEFAQYHHFDVSKMRSDDHAFHFRQQADLGIDVSGLVSVRLADGVRIVAGPVIEVSKSAVSGWIAENVSESKEADAMSDKEKQDAAGTPTVSETPNGGAREDISRALDVTELGKQVSTAVAGALAPTLTELAMVMKTGFDAIAEKMAAVAPKAGDETETETETDTTKKTPEAGDETGGEGGSAEGSEGAGGEGDAAGASKTIESGAEGLPVEVSKSLGGLGSVLSDLVKNIQSLQTQVIEVKKSNEALAKSVPTDRGREESVGGGSRKKDDPNAVFDDAWTFLRPSE